ncbi:hypothetical protein C8Q74DRAFT_1274675 [Fomes fomentarius]|nr:hypothetical protein C8Q74DRAFT_1274675 [Fomes fomentarius]
MLLIMRIRMNWLCVCLHILGPHASPVWSSVHVRAFLRVLIAPTGPSRRSRPAGGLVTRTRTRERCPPHPHSTASCGWTVPSHAPKAASL